MPEVSGRSISVLSMAFSGKADQIN